MTKQKLKQYRALHYEINMLMTRLDVVACGGVTYDRVGVSGGGRVSDPVGDLTAKKEPILNLYQERYNAACALFEEINEWLNSIDDSYIRTAIDMHYIRGDCWQYIATRLTRNVADARVISNMCTRYIRASETEEEKRGREEKNYQKQKSDEKDENNML